MGWLKRNLFFVIGGGVAVALLAWAGVYNFNSWRHNSEAREKLYEAYGALQDLNIKNPSPGNDKVNNIAAAREQDRQLRAWIQEAENYFKPIPPIPNPANGMVTDAEFAAARDTLLNELYHDAQDAGVSLPPQYGFSFQAERPLVKFAPGSLNPLAAQLGEVKAVCDILFGAKINSLDGIQRESVSADDANGPQSDYVDSHSVTNDLAVVEPYTVTFRCFSADLANVLAGFASSKNGFIVKAINVMPAGAFLGTQSSEQAAPAAMPAPMGARGGLQTVLDEQLLRVTLALEIVKLSKK